MSSHDKELARVKGIEGYIKKKYPNLYEFFKKESEKKGKPVIELIMEYANFGASVKQWGATITPEELEGLDPKSLYIALKLMEWISQKFFTVLAYANVSTVQAMHQMVMQQMALMQGMGEESGGGGAPVIMPAPARAHRLDKLVDLVREGIRAFNIMMQQQVSQQSSSQSTTSSIARRIAERLKASSEGEEGNE